MLDEQEIFDMRHRGAQAFKEMKSRPEILKELRALGGGRKRILLLAKEFWRGYRAALKQGRSPEEIESLTHSPEPDPSAGTSPTGGRPSGDQNK